MTSIGELARRFGLSRSTLLYYDKVGVLCPAARAENGYRAYSEADCKNLELICLYRKAGLPLAGIKKIIDSPERIPDQALNRRLAELEEEMAGLRGQQQLVLSLLKRQPPQDLGVMDKKRWTALLVASGFSEKDMLAWHRGFEKSAPKKHQAFLQFLGIPEDEIRQIRARCEHT
ncbi:MAG: MerR family transcriptional regulator [Rhodospirillaceae bacterium]|jgi:MerR family transcriptional regulator, thiopeptide resistance regulator|nr:MerR family transcriptional regulator [Rhodospirillaceae bacterium]MBT5242690.1 MerR family transcriptional regulator [Rhodospirillaceae bacterium]